jgi:hypothetical protein
MTKIKVVAKLFRSSWNNNFVYRETEDEVIVSYFDRVEMKNMPRYEYVKVPAGRFVNKEKDRKNLTTLF